MTQKKTGIRVLLVLRAASHASGDIDYLDGPWVQGVCAHPAVMWFREDTPQGGNCLISAG